MLVEIPDNIFTELKKEAQGIIHGALYLEIHFRDSYARYFKINREKSNSISPMNMKTEGDQDITRVNSNNHSSMRKGMKNG